MMYSGGMGRFVKQIYGWNQGDDAQIRESKRIEGEVLPDSHCQRVGFDVHIVFYGLQTRGLEKIPRPRS